MRKTSSGIYINNMAAILPQSSASFCIMAANPREKMPIDMDSKYTESLRTNNYILWNNYRISPNGPTNNFPVDLRHLLDADNNMHGMLRTKIDLLIAGGTFLYRNRIVGEGSSAMIIRDPVLDDEISDWLEECDFDMNLQAAAVDWMYVENAFTLFRLNKFARLEAYKSRRRIFPETLDVEDCRLEVKDEHGKINHVFVADWTDAESRANPIVYPMVDRSNPWRYKACVQFERFPFFGSKYYGRPPFIGAEKYIDLAGLIPYWHKDNITRGQFKWHVEVAQVFWDKLLQEQGISPGTEEEEQFLTKFLETIDAVLYSSTAENAQRRIHSRFETNQNGQPEHGIIITALQDNTEKNSKAYLDLYNTTNEAKISSVHLDPALSNTYQEGKLSSGSEKMHAFNLHRKVATPMPHKFLLKPWNWALRANFPAKSEILIGFADIELNTQDKGKEGFADVSTVSNN